MRSLDFRLRGLHEVGCAVERASDGLPVDPGATVNCPFVDFTPEISGDGLSLYFSSDRPGGLSPAPDLWVAQQSSVDQRSFSPAISDDATTMFFASDRLGGSGDLDLWVVARAREPQK